MKGAPARLKGTIAFGCLAATALVGSTGPSRASEAVSATLSLPDPHPTLHEPIVLDLEIKNNTSGTIHFDLGRDRKGSFSLVAKLPSGRTIQVPGLRKSGFARLGLLTVKPGQSYSQALLLNEWMDFGETGKYEVGIQLATPIYGEDNNQLAAPPTFQEEITVGARDELALSKACDALVRKIEEFESYESSSQAALELSYISDPIAVPYMRRALTGKRLVEPIVIHGLEKIGNLEAVRALGDGLDIQYNDTSELSRAALLRIESQTSDPTVRREVSRLLKAAATRSEGPW